MNTKAEPSLSLPVSSVHDWQSPHLRLSVDRCPPNLTWPSHAHEHGKICLLVQGQYRERVGIRTFEYHPFHSMYHPPGFDHNGAVGEMGGTLLSLSFDKELFQGVDFCRFDLTPLRDLSGRKHVWRILNLFTAMPSLSPIEIEAAAVTIILDIVSGAKQLASERRSLLAAREFVFANYKSSLTLAEVARAVRLHPVYLGQLFVKEMKQPLGDFANDLRVRAAAEDLSRGSLSLSAIAAEQGFFDQSHFSRVFKQKVGITPEAFRLRHRDVGR